MEHSDTIEKGAQRKKTLEENKCEWNSVVYKTGHSKYIVCC